LLVISLVQAAVVDLLPEAGVAEMDEATTLLLRRAHKEASRFMSPALAVAESTCGWWGSVWLSGLAWACLDLGTPTPFLPFPSSASEHLPRETDAGATSKLYQSCL